ncbi:MAG: heparinase II/III family protein [Bacillota bacterium]
MKILIKQLIVILLVFSSILPYIKIKEVKAEENVDELVTILVKEDLPLLNEDGKEIGELKANAKFFATSKEDGIEIEWFGDQIAIEQGYVEIVTPEEEEKADVPLLQQLEMVVIKKDSMAYELDAIIPVATIKTGTTVPVLEDQETQIISMIAGKKVKIQKHNTLVKDEPEEIKQSVESQETQKSQELQSAKEPEQAEEKVIKSDANSFLSADLYFRVTADFVPVYKKQDGQLVEIAYLQKDAIYKRTKDYTSWHQVTLGDEVVYVHKENTIPASGESIHNFNTTLKNEDQSITIMKDTVVYDNSGDSLVAFVQVKSGTKISILKKYTSWYAVEIAGRIGYIRSSDVKSEFPASANYFLVTEGKLPVYDNSTGELVVVGYVLKGEVYPRTKDYTSWHRITFGEINGFVAKDGTIPATSTSLKNLNKKKKQTSRTITFSRDTVAYDNTSGSLVPFAEIKNGQTFSIIAEYTSWWEIDVAGRIAFVKKDSAKANFKENEKDISLVPSYSSRYNPFVITTTKTTALYKKSGKTLVRTSGLAKDRAFVPEGISSSYYIIKPSSTTYYIPIADAKLTIAKPIYLTNFKGGEFERLVSHYYTKSSIGEIPYIYNEYNPSTLKQIADNAIKGNWELLANPYYLTVSNLNTFDWRSNLPFVNSYLFQLNYLMVVEQLTQAYKQYGDPEYLTYAKAVIESWYKYFPVEGYRSYKWGYNDHGTALRCFILIDFWNVYKKTSLHRDTEFANTLMTLFYEHAWLLSQKDFYRPHNNHGMFQDLALLAISETFPEMSGSKEWKSIATKRLMEQITLGISTEGLHMEHSPSYQLYIYNSLIDFVDWGQKNGFTLPEEMITRVKAMPDALTYLTKPDTTIPLFGDSPASKMSTNLVPYPEQYPEMMYSFTQGNEGIKPVERAINLSNQFAILRQHWGGKEPFDQSVYFGMTAGFHSTAHKHPDDLSIELYGFGGDYVVETGRYAYLASPQRSTAMSTAGHNVVQVEGTEFSLDKANLEKSRIEKVGIRSDGIMEAVGSHSLTPGVKHKRSVYYDQEKTLIIVDNLQSSTTKNYIQRFHLAPDFTVTKKGVRETIATHPSGRTLTAIQLYAPNDITEEVGTSHVAYRDYTWLSRPELMYKQRGSNVRYMTIMHLGETSDDTMTYSDLKRDGNYYIVNYKTSTSNEMKTIRFSSSW